MTKYIVVYEDEDKPGYYLKWEDADIKTEFVTEEDAWNYIINIQPVGVDLDVMMIRQ